MEVVYYTYPYPSTPPLGYPRLGRSREVGCSRGGCGADWLRMDGMAGGRDVAQLAETT